MKRIVVVVGVAAVALAAVALVMVGLRADPAQAQSSNEGDTECVGALPPGVYDGNVVVPEFEFCIIEESEVRGNVLVRPNAGLYFLRSAVEGDILVGANASLYFERSAAQGDVKGVAHGTSILIRDDSSVLGNIEVLRGSYLDVSFNALRGTDSDGAPLGLRGDVKAGQNSSIFAWDSIILGNVVGDKTVQVEVLDTPGILGPSVVGKNIVIKEGIGGTEPDLGSAAICGTTVEEGNIQVEKLHNSNVLVGDDVFCGHRSEDGQLLYGGGNRVLKGDIQVRKNTIPSEATLGVDDNFVPEGNVQVFKNVGEGPKTVQNNQVGKDLQCFANTPLFVGGPNIAQKAEGQCF